MDEKPEMLPAIGRHESEKISRLGNLEPPFQGTVSQLGEATGE